MWPRKLCFVQWWSNTFEHFRAENSRQQAGVMFCVHWLSCVCFWIARLGLLSSLSCSLCRLRGLELCYCKPLEHRCRSMDGVSIFIQQSLPFPLMSNYCLCLFCMCAFCRPKALQQIAKQIRQYFMIVRTNGLSVIFRPSLLPVVASVAPGHVTRHCIMCSAGGVFAESPLCLCPLLPSFSSTLQGWLPLCSSFARSPSVVSS